MRGSMELNDDDGPALFETAEAAKYIAIIARVTRYTIDKNSLNLYRTYRFIVFLAIVHIR
jgi:hypothetical protein